MLFFFVCASLQASFYMHRHCALQSNARMSKPSEHLQGGTLLVFPPMGTPGDESALVMEIHWVLSLTLFIALSPFTLYPCPAWLVHEHAALPPTQAWPFVPVSEASLCHWAVCHPADEHTQPLRLFPKEWTHRPKVHQPQQVPSLFWHQLVSQVHEWTNILRDMGSPSLPGCLQCEKRFLCPVRGASWGYAEDCTQAFGLQSRAYWYWPEDLQAGNGSTSLWSYPGHVQDWVCPT